MRGFSSPWRRLAALAAPGLFALAPTALANPPITPPRIHTAATPVLPSRAATAEPIAPPAAATERRRLDLATCLAIALEKQPAIAAARASLAAAVARQQAVDKLSPLTVFQRDLRARRQQAGLGVLAAQAGVTLAEMDTVYAVQFTYVSYLYAKAQEDVARQIREDIQLDMKAAVEAAIEAKLLSRDLDMSRIDAFLAVAMAREQEASHGARRALSALAEAMGLDCSGGFVPAGERLVQPSVTVRCEEIVGLALSRRPELVQASLGVEVADLEVSAQASRPLALSLRTFAIGSDLHANPLPAGVADGEYRPGAVGPEMPVTMSGCRGNRIEQAQIYHGRFASVLEKTRNLIRLQAEQAVLRWQEAGERVRHLQQAEGHARRARAAYRDVFRKNPTSAALTDRLRVARFLTETTSQLNEARYQYLLALVSLERSTTAGFRSGIAEAEKGKE